VGGGRRNLIGPLPKVSRGLYPPAWVDADGYPRQLAFGFMGSTGGAVDTHEIGFVTAVRFAGVPRLTVAPTVYTVPRPGAGDPVSYVIEAGVATKDDENAAISVTTKIPSGVRPLGGPKAGWWTCKAPVGQSITCTRPGVPVTAASPAPPLTITGVVTSADVTADSIARDSVVTASSDDAELVYARATMGRASPAPDDLAISPANGPTGGHVTITGTHLPEVTAVQVGTALSSPPGPVH
jgi:hypothetical protein